MEIDLQQYIKKTVLHLLYQLKQKERNLYWLKCMIYNALQEMLGMFPSHLLLQKNYTSLFDQNLDQNWLEQHSFMDHYLQKFDLFIFYHQRADPDLWMRKTAEGGYYYIARYIDDVMYFSKNPEKIVHYRTLKISIHWKVLDIHNSILGMLMLTMQGIM